LGVKTSVEKLHQKIHGRKPAASALNMVFTEPKKDDEA
jgi:hypothetical protein